MTKVTDDVINAEIKIEEYVYCQSSPTLTICVLALRNGFSVVGQSACVDPAEFDPEKGKELAFQDARSKVWAFLGFRLADNLHGIPFEEDADVQHPAAAGK